MMRVRLKCYGVLRKYLPPAVRDNVAEIEVPAGIHIADLLRYLGVVEPQTRVFVNGLAIQDELSQIPELAEVVLLIPAAGG